MLLFLYTTMNHMLQYAHYELLFPTNLSALEFQTVGSTSFLLHCSSRLEMFMLRINIASDSFVSNTSVNNWEVAHRRSMRMGVKSYVLGTDRMKVGCDSWMGRCCQMNVLH